MNQGQDTKLWWWNNWGDSFGSEAEERKFLTHSIKKNWHEESFETNDAGFILIFIVWVKKVIPEEDKRMKT